MMRKTLVVFSFLALFLVFSCVPAHAQTEIGLVSAGCSSCFSFAVSGTSVSLNLTTGIGLGINVGPPGFPFMTDFTLTGNGNPILLTQVGSTGVYDVASGNKGAFDLTFTMGVDTVLSGVLTIQDISVTGNSVTVNTSSFANYTIKGGSACGVSVDCSDFGYGTLYLRLPGLFPTSGTTTAGFDLGAGSLRIPPTAGMTPEPTSMLLFGTGLVLLGGVLRRRGALRQNPADS